YGPVLLGMGQRRRGLPHSTAVLGSGRVPGIAAAAPIPRRSAIPYPQPRTRTIFQIICLLKQLTLDPSITRLTRQGAYRWPSFRKRRVQPAKKRRLPRQDDSVCPRHALRPRFLLTRNILYSDLPLVAQLDEHLLEHFLGHG